jgi:hypothetical protein
MPATAWLLLLNIHLHLPRSTGSMFSLFKADQSDLSFVCEVAPKGMRSHNPSQSSLLASHHSVTGCCGNNILARTELEGSNDTSTYTRCMISQLWNTHALNYWSEGVKLSESATMNHDLLDHLL